MSKKTISGGCQCGQIRYALQGEPILAAICHCTMCRRANAAPAVAWAMYKETDVRFSGVPPTEYRSSADAARGFCSRCGTQISFTAEFIPGLIDITIGSLDDPNAIEPQFHYWYSKHLSWVNFEDRRPKHAELPSQADSGNTEA